MTYNELYSCHLRATRHAEKFACVQETQDEEKEKESKGNKNKQNNKKQKKKQKQNCQSTSTFTVKDTRAAHSLAARMCSSYL